MDSLMEKGYDFSLHISELVRYLRDDGKGFPLSDTLLACGIGAGLGCRSLESGGGKRQRHKQAQQALSYITEADFIIEMAVKGGYLTALQSTLIRANCKTLADMVQKHGSLIQKDEE